MLSRAHVTMMLPVVDLARARDFYERKLGLMRGSARPDGKYVYPCGPSASLALFPRSVPSRADHTAVSFQVPDLAATIAALEERGVRFEDYDLPGLKTENHVCVLGSERAAWFQDTEGNLLCVHEELA